MSQIEINSILIALGYFLFFVHVTIVRYRFNSLIESIDHILLRRHEDSSHDIDHEFHDLENKILHAAEVPNISKTMRPWNPAGSGEGRLP